MMVPALPGRKIGLAAIAASTVLLPSLFQPGSCGARPVVVLEPIACESAAGFRCCDSVSIYLERGAARYGYLLHETVLRKNETPSNSPEIKLSLMSEEWLTGNTNMFYGHTHGNDGGHGPDASDGGNSAWEYFIDSEDRNERYFWYLSSGWETDQLNIGQTGGGSHAIGITCQGIREKFALSHEANGLMKWCYSSTQRDAWMDAGCDAVHAFEGPSDYDDCPKFEYAASILSCEQYFNHGEDSSWEGYAMYATVGQHPLASWFRYFHSRFNTMRPGKSCANPTVTFGDCGVKDGYLFFAGISEVGIDHYDCVGGFYPAPGARGELHLLGRIPADARGGAGKGVHYNLPGVSMAYDFYAVYAIDAWGGLDTESPEFFAVDEFPPDWHAWVGHQVYDFSADIGEYREAPLLFYNGERFVDGSSHIRHSDIPFRTGGKPNAKGRILTNGEPDTTFCASVVVYSSRDSLALAAYERIIQYQTPRDRTIVVLGSDDPCDARAWYETIQWANHDHNMWALEHGDTLFYPTFWPGPVLVVVGDPGGDDERVVGYMIWEDDPDINACRQPYCRSDQLMTDCWGEMLPNGPVLRVSGDSVEDIIWQVDAARNFTDGVDVDSDYGALFLAGDGGRYPGTEIPRIAYTTDYVEAWQEDASSWVTSRGLIRRSDFETNQEGTTAIAALSELGTAFWMGYGWETRNDLMPTRYIYGGMDRSDFQRRQEVVWVFPGCEVANLSWDSWWPTVQEEWRDADGTRIAALLGGINGSWSPDHQIFADFVQFEMARADGSEPLQVRWWRALLDVCMQVPRLRAAAMGQAMLGAPIFHFSSDAPGLAVNPTRERPPSVLGLQVLNSPMSSGEGSEIRIEIPERGRVKVQVFDVLGRRVSDVTDRTFEAGTQRVWWAGLDRDGRTLGPGVYFLRMVSSSGAATCKAVIVQ